MALDIKYINLTDSENGVLDSKLFEDNYNLNELTKSLDINVSELVNPLPEVRDDLIQKYFYDFEVSKSIQLNEELENFTLQLNDAKNTLDSLITQSGSLFIENLNIDKKLSNSTKNETKLIENIKTIQSGIKESINKCLNEATERTALEAENEGLIKQKDALIKYIDRLNALLADATQALDDAQAAIDKKNEAIANGGVSTGEYATLIWEKGDPWKNKIGRETGYAYMFDLKDGGQTWWRFAQNSAEQSSKWVEILAGPKDIDVDFKQTFFVIPDKFSIKANETVRIEFIKPIIYSVPSPKNKSLRNAAKAAQVIASSTAVVAGAGGYLAAVSIAGFLGGAATFSTILTTIGSILGPVGWIAVGVVLLGTLIWGSPPKYQEYNEEIIISVVDKDNPTAKKEEKIYKARVYSYD